MKSTNFRSNYSFQRTVWYAPKELTIKSCTAGYPPRVCVAVGRNIDDDSLYILVRSRSTSQWLPAQKILSARELSEWMSSSVSQ